MYDYLVVGSGFFGSVFAREAYNLGKKVLVIDKRNHIGGNCYSKIYNGINVHEYGPHIFNTNNEKIWEYVNSFSEFNNYRHKVKSFANGKYYSFPINLQTIYQIYPELSSISEVKKLFQSFYEFKNPTNFEELAIDSVGKHIYELLIKGYTEKQWGRDAKTIDSSVFNRLPIRFNFNDDYHEKTYSGVPKNGYEDLFKNILGDIPLELNTDYFSDRDDFDKLAKYVVYTGPIDRFFGYIHGDLEYRSLKFSHHLVHEDYQGIAQVNFPNKNIPWTRIIEHKYFNFKPSKESIITYEFPEEYNKLNDPYYPINSSENNEIFRNYLKMIDKNKYIFGGRLANYAYMNMDQTIISSLKTFENHIKGII